MTDKSTILRFFGNSKDVSVKSVDEDSHEDVTSIALQLGQLELHLDAAKFDVSIAANKDAASTGNKMLGLINLLMCELAELMTDGDEPDLDEIGKRLEEIGLDIDSFFML